MNGYELVRKQPTQDTAIEARVKKTGDSMTGNLSMTNNAKIIGNVQGNATTATTATTATKVANSLILNVGGQKTPFNGQAQVEVYVAPNVHNHGSDIINKMTGYVKGTSSASIVATDTLNSAIGKLENKVDSKANSTHTHNYAGSNTAGGAANSALTCTGNSATATKLQNARTINGVAFDGTKNITVADNTKLPLTGGTLTGNLKIAKSNAQLTLNGKDTNYYQIAHSSANGTLVFNYNGKSLFTVQNNGNIIPIINNDISIGDYNFKLKSIASEDYTTSAAKIVTTSQPNTIQVQGVEDSGMGAIRLGTGGCRIYGTGSAGKLYIEGGIYTNLEIEGKGISSSGYVAPTLNAQGGWDCGLGNKRFYTVYCVNVNQSSDRNMKEDIQYLDEKDNSKLKMISSKEDTPFRDFLKDELRLASYKYKRQQTIEAEDGTETIKTLPHKEEDSQLGFIAQDIKNTEIGSMFVYGEDGNMSYSPTGFTTVVAKALQEEIKCRDKQIERLEEKIKLLEKKVDSLVS